eukprot:Em0020g1093a
MLGMYDEAKRTAEMGAPSGLQNRLLFHLAHKCGDETELMSHHTKLQNCIEDQVGMGYGGMGYGGMGYGGMGYGGMGYGGMGYGGMGMEALGMDAWGMEHGHMETAGGEMLAVNVYLAMCYHKLDYYDVSQEVLASYVQNHPDSAIAINLKACNVYKLYNGKAAETELKVFTDMASPTFTFAKDLLRHNLVIFRNGDGALQTFPQLLGVVQEARLNLAIYHLKHDNIDEAYTLIRDLEPGSPHEYILKAVANAVMGQEHGSQENIKLAQQYYQLVGTSGSECDTIPGRQSMASCFFLLRQFEEVLIYLSSIKSYFFNDDTFNFNFAQAKAATGNFQEAEEVSEQTTLLDTMFKLSLQSRSFC